MSRARWHRWLLTLSMVTACATTEDSELARRAQEVKAHMAGEARTAAVTIDPKHARLELQLADGATTWCPAALNAPQLRAVVHTPDIDLLTPVRLTTAAPGYYPRTAVDLKVTGATLGPEWILSGPSEPLALLALQGKRIDVAGHLVKHPTVASTLALTTTFDCDQGADFPGRPGRQGGNGGMRGENGEDGLDVAVTVAYLRPVAGQKLVLVKASPSIGPPAYFIVTPNRRVGINARGGDGGTGGYGTVNQTSYGTGVGFGVSEVQFSGGLGGDGGNGGRVMVSVDPRHPELRGVITVVNPGGKGGKGGSNGDGSTGPAGRVGRSGPPARFESAAPETSFREEIEAGLPIAGSGSSPDI